MERIGRNKSFDGWQERWRHDSQSNQCEMTFSIYLPPQARDGKVPLLLWLSGLTCTDENFVLKAGAQRYAAEHSIAVLCPDTSPRGEDVADSEGWDMGQGAGFYVDATESPWSAHYNMYSYVTQELPNRVAEQFPLDMTRQSICGHSMGGHGALICALKNPGRYRSVSAFSPICAPTQCEWGRKALTGYLGNDPSVWADWDASKLVAKASERLPLLIEQGEDDEFLAEQLLIDELQAACVAHDHSCTVNMRPGYDHSYFFIASFIGDHMAWHAQALQPL